MKKGIIKWIAGSVLVVLAGPVLAQDINSIEGERSLFSVSGGFSYPRTCYASADINHSTSGFATKGTGFDCRYVYRFTSNAGLSASLFYNENHAGNNGVEVVSTPGSYRLLGILAGPVITKNFIGRLDADIALLAGATRVLTPNLQYQEATILNEYRSTAFTWGAGLSLRYTVLGRIFLSVKSELINLKPEFPLKPGETGKPDQYIEVMNLNAGIGVKF